MSELNLAEYAQEQGLKRMGARPPLIPYIAEAFKRRDFSFALSAYSNEAANARNLLGRWWLILLPTLQAATYGLIFGIILGRQRPDNFLAFLFTGVFLFSFMSGSFSSGASAITSNAGLVRSLSFPRILLPVSAVIRQFLNLLPQLLVLAVLLVIIQGGVGIQAFAIVPVIALMLVFSLGLAMIAARLTVHFRDLTKLIPFITRVFFYTSGVFFSVDKLLVDHPQFKPFVYLNPFYDFIELARGALVFGYQTSWQLWASGGAWALTTLIIGTVFFWKAEERYGRE